MRRLNKSRSILTECLYKGCILSFIKCTARIHYPEEDQTTSAPTIHHFLSVRLAGPVDLRTSKRTPNSIIQQSLLVACC